MNLLPPPRYEIFAYRAEDQGVDAREWRRTRWGAKRSAYFLYGTGQYKRHDVFIIDRRTRLTVTW